MTKVRLWVGVERMYWISSLSLSLSLSVQELVAGPNYTVTIELLFLSEMASGKCSELEQLHHHGTKALVF